MTTTPAIDTHSDSHAYWYKTLTQNSAISASANSGSIAIPCLTVHDSNHIQFGDLILDYNKLKLIDRLLRETYPEEYI